MALPHPQLIDGLIITLEDPANQSEQLALALRNSADTYSEAETDQAIQDAIGALPPPGDVSGPLSAIAGNVVVFATITGKELADSEVAILDVEAAIEKTEFLTVTQPVDLDAMEIRINQLDAAVVLKGTWSAAGGTFPGGGTAQAGDSWIVSTGGTVDGVVFTANDRIIAITDNASTTTFAGNWFKADYTDQVQSVNGQTGAVTIEAIIHAATGKTTPVDADELCLVDSAASNVLKKLTWANLKATVRTYLLGIASQWSAPQWGSVTTISISGGTSNWDLASNNDFELTLTANTVLQFPSNASTHIRQKGSILIKQDGTGGRTFGVVSGLKVLGSASLPSILTAANAQNYLAYEVIDASTIAISLSGVGG